MFLHIRRVKRDSIMHAKGDAEAKGRFVLTVACLAFS